MIRFVFLFFILAAMIHFGIATWRKMSGSERWSLTKTLGYSTMIAALAVMVMMFIVILF